MKTVKALEVRASFGRILDEAAAGERFVVERAGVPIAAIVPLTDIEHLDPERIRARRKAAVAEMVRLGRRDLEKYGPFDAVAAIREDRDHGHRP